MNSPGKSSESGGAFASEAIQPGSGASRRKIKIKMCGITNVNDAKSAVACGTDYLGLIFAPSLRQVKIEQALEIKEAVGDSCPVVGVFKNMVSSQIAFIVKAVGLDMVQLYGEEPAEALSLIEVPVIKVFSDGFTMGLRSTRKVEKFIDEYQSVAKYIMFDRPKGTDDPQWLTRCLNTLLAVSQLPKFFLAGGINSDNVGAILNVIQPYCIDVTSGIEHTVGIKDERLMKAFCQIVKGAH